MRSASRDFPDPEGPARTITCARTGPFLQWLPRPDPVGQTAGGHGPGGPWPRDRSARLGRRVHTWRATGSRLRPMRPRCEGRRGRGLARCRGHGRRTGPERPVGGERGRRGGLHRAVTRTLSVAPAMADVARSAAAALREDCVELQVESAASAQVARRFEFDKNVPDLWIAESNTWQAQLFDKNVQLRIVGPALASSPVVLAGGPGHGRPRDLARGVRHRLGRPPRPDERRCRGAGDAGAALGDDRDRCQRPADPGDARAVGPAVRRAAGRPGRRGVAGRADRRAWTQAG